MTDAQLRDHVERLTAIERDMNDLSTSVLRIDTRRRLNLSAFYRSLHASVDACLQRQTARTGPVFFAPAVNPHTQAVTGQARILRIDREALR